MVKIYVDQLEIETERYIEEGPKPIVRNIDGMLDLLDGQEISYEFEEFFKKGVEDLA